MNWYIKVLKQYADFSGRARRKEYWMFVLFNTIFGIVAIFFDNILGLTVEGVSFGAIFLLYTLVVSIPGLAITIRRLHDVGKSGWFVLIQLIPFIGGIWLLAILLADSMSDQNKYGPNPKKNIELELVSILSNSESVVFLALIWTFVETIWRPLLESFPIFFVDYGYAYNLDKLIPIQFLMQLTGALIPMWLSYAIKERIKRLISFALGALIFVYSIISTVDQIIDKENSLMFLTAVFPTIGAIWLIILMIKRNSLENKKVGLDTDIINKSPADVIILLIVVFMFLTHLLDFLLYLDFTIKSLVLLKQVIKLLILVGYVYVIKNKSTRVVTIVLCSILSISRYGVFYLFFLI